MGIGPLQASPSSRYLRGRVSLVEDRLHAEVAARRAERSGTRTGTSGATASDSKVDDVLADLQRTQRLWGPAPSAARRALDDEADEAERDGHDVRFRDLSRLLLLSPLEEEVLLVALAPALDARIGSIYAYLNEDATRPHATVATTLTVAGGSVADASVRRVLEPEATLRRAGLVDVMDEGRPFPSRTVRVPDRAVSHLLGNDGIDPLLASMLEPALPVEGATANHIRRALEAVEPGSQLLVHVQDPDGLGAASQAASALESLGYESIVLDLDRLAPGHPIEVMTQVLAMEATLADAGLVIGPVDGLGRQDPAALRAIAGAARVVVLHGREPWDPAWSTRVPVSLHAAPMAAGELERLWREALGPVSDETLDAIAGTASFRLTPQQIHRAALAARQEAEAAGRALEPHDLHRGIRAQNSSGLRRLSQRVEPRVGWDDIVLPPRVERQLRELPIRWRHRDRVLEDWGMGRGVASGRGVSAMFAGPSGTGKTLAAEVVAADLGLDLYVVDLSTVVDKYIGETSKNLNRIFDEADNVNGVLLFDEADALFGKRSAVSDSKDRHANVEVAFLLQRMETFDGIAILTSNLASNLDEAFLRRLDAIIDFPAPDESLRRALWEAKLRSGVPRGDDIDVDQLAREFTLSGAEITNVVISAAYQAADRGDGVSMRDLVEAIVREHRKLGRPLTRAELGEWVGLLD